MKKIGEETFTPVTQGQSGVVGISKLAGTEYLCLPVTRWLGNIFLARRLGQHHSRVSRRVKLASHGKPADLLATSLALRPLEHDQELTQLSANADDDTVRENLWSTRPKYRGSDACGGKARGGWGRSAAGAGSSEVLLIYPGRDEAIPSPLPTQLS
ncbi:hypothetical protein E2C01_035296 [Portunus trituberculatus]|uniref:Uncharacterized protein n=1 Tax=Portunus trituberculatus TaxID=210409 RepID=A0A5B7F8U6_PORTR|nr:hypothetical protein [Portunus trituberculatus]